MGKSAAAPAPTAENLEIFAGGFYESAGPALTTVLNRKVAVSGVEVSSTSLTEMLAAGPLPWVVVEISYQRGLKGTHFLILRRPSALSLVRALAGTETDDLSTSQLEGIRDAVNQILVAAGPTLMPLFGRSISFAPVAVQLVEDPDLLPQGLVDEGEELWVLRAHAEGEEFTVEMALTIGAALARDIAAVGNVEAALAPSAEEVRAPAAGPAKIDLILDVTLPVTVELGRARMQIQDILKLAPGSVIELDKSAGDPVELYINERPIAKGEVVIIDENFGVRLTSIVTATERIKTLR
jgi:flagellar motor switch protein FliN/FliY